MTVRISLIVAAARNGVIGRNGELPWRISSDLKNFRRLTIGKPIIMGRKTFASLKKPLDGRDNIVVTRDPHFEAAGVSVFHSVHEALVLARALARTNGSDEVMIIGGAEVFEETLPLADRLYWTEVEASPEGDVVFPPIDLSTWTKTASEPLDRGPRDDYPATLVIYDRKV